MALADILTRIASDSDTETDAIVAAAQEQAEAVVAEARLGAQAHRSRTIASAKAAAAREAETILVNARLAARDTEVSARRALIGETLAATVEKLAQLPDSEYARFLAEKIAATARGGESLAFGSEDAGRAERVIDELARIAPHLPLTRAEQPAPFARGALLQGRRVKADLSLPALVGERREELEIAIGRTLFADEEA